jgi:hypothetical protein
MRDNMDATERRIASSSDLFCEVSKALEAWHEKSSDETRALEVFKLYVCDFLSTEVTYLAFH